MLIKSHCHSLLSRISYMLSMHHGGRILIQKAHAQGRTQIMGILNITPDSFSDGGQLTSVDAAVQHARKLVSEGADVLDIGGQSTRPGADRLTAAQEASRVVPVIRWESPACCTFPQADCDSRFQTLSPCLTADRVPACFWHQDTAPPDLYSVTTGVCGTPP